MCRKPAQYLRTHKPIQHPLYNLMHLLQKQPGGDRCEIEEEPAINKAILFSMKFQSSNSLIAELPSKTSSCS